MEYIEFTIIGKHIVCRRSGVIADNTDYMMRFAFDEGWADYPDKTVLVLDNEGKIWELHLTGGAAEVKLPKFIGRKLLAVGVTATAGDGEISTDAVSLRVNPSIRTGASEVIESPESGAKDMLEEYRQKYDALIAELQAAIDSTYLGVTGAEVGQIVKIKAVDENGIPTEWEAADGDGDSKPFVVTVTYGDNGTLTADKTHAEIVAAYAAGAQINAKIVNYPGVIVPSILPLYVNNSDERFIFSGSGVLDGRAMAMTAQDFNGSWSVSLTGIAKQDDIPTSLKNPQSLVLESEGNNKVYDGSSAVNVVIPCNTKVMTVTAAGAKGDGVTDDTAAFKTALENYRDVFVPGGTYKLTEGITIRDACKLELAPDAVLNFTQTTGNCISMKMSAYLCGNHAVIEVPYGFSGNVIYVSTALNTSVTDVPPFTKWDPQWKTARYITDISISKQDSRGFHYSIDGGCSGTAVYIEADGGATSTFIWGLNFSGIRIAGAFSYGIHAKTIGSGYNHEMRLEALIDACEIGLCLEDCNNAYASVTVQPRAALTTGGENVVYAKYGIQLIRSRNTDLSGARVWDWNADKTLWTSDAGCEYQHIAMVGNCSGTILNDFLYYEMPSYDIRSLIYTDTPANLEKTTILQEPFTRWFRPVDNKPMFYNGSANNELLLKSAFDAAFQTEMVANFDNKLLTSANADGTIFNDTGYQSGAGWSTDGVTLNTGSEYAEITCTGFIPCAENAVIRLKGMSFASGNDYCRVVLFDSSKAKLMHVNRANLISNASSYFINNYSETEDGCQFTIVSASAAYLKVNVLSSTLSSSPAITVNEEMSYRQEGYLADGIKVKADSVDGLGVFDIDLSRDPDLIIDVTEEINPSLSISEINGVSLDTTKMAVLLEYPSGGTYTPNYIRWNNSIKNSVDSTAILGNFNVSNFTDTSNAGALLAKIKKINNKTYECEYRWLRQNPGTITGTANNVCSNIYRNNFDGNTSIKELYIYQAATIPVGSTISIWVV